MRNLFNGKALHSLDIANEYFPRDISSAGIWTKDEYDTNFKDLCTDAQKNLTDASQIKVYRIKHKDDMQGGLGIPVIIATNYTMPEIIAALYAKPSTTFAGNVEPLLKRFTVISTETQRRPDQELRDFEQWNKKLSHQLGE